MNMVQKKVNQLRMIRTDLPEATIVDELLTASRSEPFSIEEYLNTCIELAAEGEPMPWEKKVIDKKPKDMMEFGGEETGWDRWVRSFDVISCDPLQNAGSAGDVLTMDTFSLAQQRIKPRSPYRQQIESLSESECPSRFPKSKKARNMKVLHIGGTKSGEKIEIGNNRGWVEYPAVVTKSRPRSLMEDEFVPIENKSAEIYRIEQISSANCTFFVAVLETLTMDKAVEMLCGNMTVHA